MKLGELLDAQRLLVPLKARHVRDATTQLAQTMVKSGVVADETRFKDLLKTEWPEDIVSVGGRAFLPHFRTDAVRQLALAIGVARTPLCLAGDANRCARVIVLIVAPTGEPSEYLRAMGAVAQALSSDEVLEGLHAATAPAEVLALAGLREAQVPGDVMVRDVMTADVIHVGPEMPLREAAQLMLRRGVSLVPVTGPGGEVVGALTDQHLMRQLLPLTVSQLSTGQMRAVKRRGKGAGSGVVDPGSVPVRDVMDRTVLCLADDQTVADVAALMLAKDVDRFPVTREGALVGFLTRGDIVRKLLAT